MPRPTKPRWVEFIPDVTYFKPAGVPMSELEEVALGVDEAEAIRLKDYVGLEQEACAVRMNLAQSTFQRILTGARSKVAQALVEGKALRIEGGNYLVSPLTFECRDCKHEWANSGQSSGEPACPECGGTHLESFRKVPVGEMHGYSSDRPRGRRHGRHGRGQGRPN
ncbi:MAG: DUF134 domain-containing protein [Bacillota bacterium]|jgi:predicted DNA-binding protein (UPF0251 family)